VGEGPVAGVARSRWWVTAIIFVLGVVVGVVGVGLLSFQTPDFAAGTGGPARPAPSGRASVEVAARAEVNAACLRVINDAQDAYRALQGVGQAASQVDLQRLDDIVRQLQPVESRLQDDLPGCEVDTSVGQPSAAPPPAPVPSPSPTR
jgi:hypothetical protein